MNVIMKIFLKGKLDEFNSIINFKNITVFVLKVKDQV